MEIKWYIFLSVALFCIGIIGALTRRNSIIVFMCIELMLNSVNLLLVAFSKMHMAGVKCYSALHGNKRPDICFLYNDRCCCGSKCGSGNYCNDV